jgi:hypothetical protein
MAENGIVDFEPNSLLYYHYPKCFEMIVLSGNIFSYIKWVSLNVFSLGGSGNEIIVSLKMSTYL